MSDELNGRHIAIMTANEGVEEIELTSPRQAIEDAGATTVLIAPETGDVQAFNHLTKSSVFDAKTSTGEATVDEYDALVLPGGVANPDQLRMDDDAMRLIADFVDAGKPIGVICHGPWSLIEAGVVDGRTLTSWPSLRTDIENAGGTWVDREVVVCEAGRNTIVSSRNPDDLPAFTAQLVRTFGQHG